MDSHLISHINAFISVCEQLSMSRAAEKLGKSRAAISHSIMALEEHIKLPLFIRTTRKIELTPEGHTFYQQCQRLVDEVNATEDLLNGIHDSPSGRLSIMVSPFFSDERFIQLISLYREKYPSVDIEVTVAERMPNLKEESIDLVFGVSWPSNDDEIVRKKINDTHYIFCASPEYLNKHGTPTHLEDLSSHQYIHHLGRKRAIVKLKDRKSIPLDIAFSTNDANFMRRLALNHQGIIEVHDYLVEADIRSGRLVEVLPNLTKPTMLNIYYLKDRFVQPKIRRFMECYQQLFEIENSTHSQLND